MASQLLTEKAIMTFLFLEVRRLYNWDAGYQFWIDELRLYACAKFSRMGILNSLQFKKSCIMQLMRHTAFAICVHNSFRCMIIAFICVIIHFQIEPDSRVSERNEQICLVHTTSTRFIVERKAVLVLEQIHCSDWKKVISCFFHSSSSKAFTNPLLD